ncbi:MAG: B12-binding domain-containing radical SAM protein [Elusimicrobiales bacterium]|nr:B12-binding domain-containing radical SAM protein [Elusimicrobiales bacterium]
MKVAFIRPPFPPPHWLIGLIRDHDFPLGIGYLAAVLSRAGNEVRVFDPEAVSQPLEKMWAELEKFKPDLVGITTVTPRFEVAVKLAREAKRRLKCLVIMGGPHATALPRSTLLAARCLDAVIMGEAESSMLAVAAGFNAGGKVDFNRIPGAAFFENWNYREIPRPEFIQDLDAIPYPQRDFVHLRAYNRNRVMFGGVRCATVMSSRGCPGRCTFCANICTGRKLRLRGPENFVGEMEFLSKDHGVKYFQIYDDCFTADPKHVEAVCDLILSRGLRIRWGAFGRVNTVQDERLLRKMKRAGCMHMLLGIESGNQRILNLMRKGTTLEAAEKSCTLLRKCGISYSNSFMLGCEGETLETARDTIVFAEKLGSEMFNFVILIPFPGTELFEKYYKDFDSPDTDWENWCSQEDNRPYPMRHTSLTMEQLISLQMEAGLRYTRSPVRFMRAMRFGLRELGLAL